MRPPWLQIETDFIEVVAPDLRILLETPELQVSEGDAGWGAEKAFLWMLKRCPHDEPPSAHDTLTGPAAARLLAGAALYRGPPEQLVSAYVEVGLLELLDDGTLRLRGLRRYDEAWAKNDKERAARWASTHPDWALAHRFIGDRHGTATEPPRKPGELDGQDPRSKIQDPRSLKPPPPAGGGAGERVAVVVGEQETASLFEAMQVQREEEGFQREGRAPKGFRDWHLEFRRVGHQDDQALRGHRGFLRDTSIRRPRHPTGVFIHPEVWPLRIPPPEKRVMYTARPGEPVEVYPPAPAAGPGAADWDGMLGTLREEGKTYALSWLQRLLPVALEGAALTLQAPDELFLAWVQDHYGELLVRLGRERSLLVQLRTPGPAPPVPAGGTLAEEMHAEDERHRLAGEVLQLVREAVGGS